MNLLSEKISFCNIACILYSFLGWLTSQNMLNHIDNILTQPCFCTYLFVYLPCNIHNSLPNRFIHLGNVIMGHCSLVLYPGQDIIIYCKFVMVTLQYRWCTIQGLIPPPDTITTHTSCWRLEARRWQSNRYHYWVLAMVRVLLTPLNVIATIVYTWTDAAGGWKLEGGTQTVTITEF